MKDFATNSESWPKKEKEFAEIGVTCRRKTPRERVSVVQGFRTLSRYQVGEEKPWVITEAE